MAKRKAGTKKRKQTTDGQNGGIVALTKELFQAAITLRGSVEPADYKRYVLPIIFLRFLSLRYDRRRAELEALIADKKSDYYGDKKAIHDPDEYRRVAAFVIPEAARWENLRKAAQADDIKVKLDDVLESLENKYPDKLKGLLPRIYAGSNLAAVSVRGLINLFSKDIFEADHGGDDLIGRVYEYFIGEFASSEGKRGGEYFTPVSIVKTLVAMLEPEKGVVFDPCCGSGGMFVQSDLFTKHSHQLSFVGQESKDFTYRLCRMNLFIHGLDANIQLGNSYFDDRHATLKADYLLANPPFNDGSKGENGWGADRIADKDPRLTLGSEKLALSPRNANTMWMLHFFSHPRDRSRPAPSRERCLRRRFGDVERQAMTVMSKPMSNVDSPSPQGHEYEAIVLDVLKRAVAEALERKRKLGQYAVFWRDGRVVCIGPDAPIVPGVPSTWKNS